MKSSTMVYKISGINLFVFYKKIIKRFVAQNTIADA